MRLSAMAGLARSRFPGFSEVGYSVGARVSVQLGGASMAGGGEYPQSQASGASLFGQADYNDTGAIRTRDVVFGIRYDF